MSSFHPLEVVDRGGETQLQVGENLSLFSLALWLKYALSGHSDVTLIWTEDAEG